MALLDPNDPMSGANALLTHEQIEERRKMAARLARNAATPRQMTHPLQAFAQGLEGLTAGLDEKLARDATAALASADRSLFSGMEPGGVSSNPIVSNAAVMPSTGSTPAQISGDMPKAVYDGLIERGLSPTLAAGFAGNMHGESGFKTNIWGDKGTSFGLAQWRGDRLTALRQLAASQGKDPSDMGVQLDHLVGELKGPERKAFELASAAKTPEEAAWAIARHYERPAEWALAKSGPGRAGFARSVFDKFGQRADAGAPPVRVASLGGTANDASPPQVASLPPQAPPVQAQPGPGAPMTGSLPFFGQRFPGSGNQPFLPPEQLALAGAPGAVPMMARGDAPPPPMAPGAPQVAGTVPPMPPGRVVSTPPAAPIVGSAAAAPSPVQQIVQTLAARGGLPSTAPEPMSDQATMLDIARGGRGVPQAPQMSPAVQAVAQALGARAGGAGTATGGAPAVAGPATTGSTAPAGSPAAAAVAQTLSARGQAAWRALGSPYASESTKKAATLILQQEQEQQRYQRARQDTVADRTQDQQRADRTFPLDLRQKEAQTVKAERELLGEGATPLTPQERAQYGITAEQPAYKTRTGEIKFGPAASKTQVNIGGGSDKQIFDAMEEGSKAARAAAAGLVGLREARAAIQGGAFTGAGADIRLGLQKVGAALGVADSTKIVNTETFRAAIAPQIAAVMKATVGSTQISNADREFAEKAAGGSITLDDKSINRLLDIMERASTDVLKSHRDRIERVYPEGKNFDRERAIFSVPFAESKPTPGSGQPVRVTSPDEARKLPSGTRIILPDGRPGVVP